MSELDRVSELCFRMANSSRILLRFKMYAFLYLTGAYGRGNRKNWRSVLWLR